jgi:hypothetical protein
MSKTADDPSSSDPVTTAVAKPAVNRRSAGESSYRPPTVSDRFWRMFSKREKVIENLKTLAWVIPITLVVWIYAEREQVVTPGPLSNVPIQIQEDAGRSIEFIGNPDPTITLKLTGPQQAFEHVREQLNRIPNNLKMDLSNVGIGTNIPVNVLDRIQNNDVFKINGVTVQAVDPQYLHVNIDLLEHTEIPVEVPPGITNLSDVTFDPPKVTVRGPKSELFPSADHPPVRVFANLTGLALLKTPGKHVLPTVPISLSTDGKLHIDKGQMQVKAEFTVQDADVPGVIESMPIVIKVSPSLTKSFDISVNNGVENIYNTHVKGPKDIVDALVKNPIAAKAEAVLEISADDTSVSKQLVYTLPPGVTVDKDDEARKIEFVLKAR